MIEATIDASVVLRWAFQDENDRRGAEEIAAALTSGVVHVIAPPHFLLEVAAALVVGIRSRRITRPTADAILAELVRVSIPEHESHGFATASYRLALDHSVRVPDAAYLEVARRAGGTLISADRAQLAAAAGLGLRAVAVADVPAWIPEDD